jgi:hypothetical protein
MTGKRTRSIEDRFWALVNGPWCDSRLDPYDDCWVWMGGRTTSRRPKSLPDNKPWKVYGRFHWPLPGFPKNLINAARAALILTVGPPPTDSHVAGHRCDTSLCAHPGHLEWQTQAQNVAQALSTNRLTREANGYTFATTGARI